MTSQHPPGLVRFSDGGLLAQGALQELLERTRSGTPVLAKTEDGEAWKLKSSFTFRSAKRSPCRRYEISSESAGRFAGYACRSGEGQWFVQAHAKLATKVPKRQRLCASGRRWGRCARGGNSRSPWTGDVYQSKEEEELIASGWATLRK